MPTFATTQQFDTDYRRLNADERQAFRAAVEKFIADLRESGGFKFRRGLRVHPMRGTHGIYEMTWAGNNGRATFEFGDEQRPGEIHVIWRRVGGHDIFGNP